MKGIKDKKTIIYNKYFKILKDIVELMKVADIIKINRYTMLADMIDGEMTQMCTVAKAIEEDEKILQLDYEPEILQDKNIKLSIAG